MTLVVCLVVSSVFADTPQAMLQASGRVQINGANVPGARAVFTGDRIQTAPDATGNLTLQGTAVQAGSNTTVTFRQQALDLDVGTVVVHTTADQGVRGHTLWVHPAQKGRAEYQVTRQGCWLEVTALKDYLVMEHGPERVMIEAGHSARRWDCAGPPYEQPAGMSTATALYITGSVLTGLGLAAWFFDNHQTEISPTKP